MNVQGSVERKPIAGEVFLRSLAEHGVDFFFCNPGTDFPPIVEAFSRGARQQRQTAAPGAGAARKPRGRDGAWRLYADRPPAGRDGARQCRHRQHVNNLINLSRDRVPLILAAGRTPVTEKGSFGSRSRQIHWGQEMFDQAGMVREIVKWDYELRMPSRSPTWSRARMR